MGRLVNTESAGKDRARLCRAVVLAIRELMNKSTVDNESRDLVAFIALALLEIGQTVEESVAAWEKRGYWVKADRYRMEWDWSNQIGELLRRMVLKDDWVGIPELLVKIGHKLNSIDLPTRHRLGTPWVGAWQQLHK